MNIALVGLGSNLRHRRANLTRACRMLRRRCGIKLMGVSGVYSSAPMYEKIQPYYFNAVMILRYTGSPRLLMRKLQSIEKSLGRRRKQCQNGSRVIDLDLLYCGMVDAGKVKSIRSHTQTLTIPHPGLKNRSFVQLPLREVFNREIFNKAGSATESSTDNSLADGVYGGYGVKRVGSLQTKFHPGPGRVIESLQADVLV